MEWILRYIKSTYTFFFTISAFGSNTNSAKIQIVKLITSKSLDRFNYF